jgi:hypothetical protein
MIGRLLKGGILVQILFLGLSLECIAYSPSSSINYATDWADKRTYTAGFELGIGPIFLDYALIDMHELGLSHFISLSVKYK